MDHDSLDISLSNFCARSNIQRSIEFLMVRSLLEMRKNQRIESKYSQNADQAADSRKPRKHDNPTELSSGRPFVCCFPFGKLLPRSNALISPSGTNITALDRQLLLTSTDIILRQGSEILV